MIKCENLVYWYAYCLNNPLLYSDPSGYLSKAWLEKARQLLKNLFSKDEQIERGMDPEYEPLTSDLPLLGMYIPVYGGIRVWVPIVHSLDNVTVEAFRTPSIKMGKDWNPYDMSGETRLGIGLLSSIPFLNNSGMPHYPDAISLEINGSGGAVVSTNTSPIGGLFKLNSNIKGPVTLAFFQGSIGGGKVGASVNAIFTEYYIIGPNAGAVSMEHFSGYFSSFNASADIGMSIGAGLSSSRPFDGAQIIGISYSLGLGVGGSMNFTGGILNYYNRNNR